MSSFESTQNQFVQEQFEVLEIDLPVITGACTIGGDQGFGTPLSCDQAWADEYKTYFFTNENAPLLANNAQRCIMSVSEQTAEIKPGNGLAARGSLSIKLIDFIGDPNLEAPGVTNDVKNQGTFFGKLLARQILENKTVRLKLYRVEKDGSIDLINGAQSRLYLIKDLKNNNNGTWTLSCKDVLSGASIDEKVWPETLGGTIRSDIDDFVTAIPVDGIVDYSAAEVVRVNDEFMRVLSVTGNQTGSAVLNVDTRGLSVFGTVGGVRLTTTTAEEHEIDDEVFVCKVSDDQAIDDLLTEILTDSDVDPIYIPAAEWAAEVAEWHPNDKINTLHSESEDVNNVLTRVLTGFLMDMWFESSQALIKLSAISVWKESDTTISEGKEINAHSLKYVASEKLRATRALVLYDKKNLADDEETKSYSKASRFSDSTLISEALYKEPKDKVFDNNFLIDTDAANLLTQRYVSRFKTPFDYSFTTPERLLTFSTGDVVDMNSINLQGFSGLSTGNIRAQITNIKPKYDRKGRSYMVKALSYDAVFSTGSEIVLNTPLSSVNLYILAGAPSEAVELTFVLDGTYSAGSTAISAGNFPTGSKLIIIMVNGFDGQAQGGNGGAGGKFTARNGKGGGIVYFAKGVDTDIYFSGATPSVAFPVADGYIRAPGGGGGGGVAAITSPAFGGGGGGGAGRNPGLGAEILGVNGDIIGNGGDGGVATMIIEGGAGGGWGEDGFNGRSLSSNPPGSGGSKGSGVLDGGATVVFFGDTAMRYINGNGDH